MPFTGAKQLAEFTVIDVEVNRDTMKSKVRNLYLIELDNLLFSIFNEDARILNLFIKYFVEIIF